MAEGCIENFFVWFFCLLWLFISNILDHRLYKIHEMRIHQRRFVKIRTLTYLAPFCLHRFSRCPRLFFSSINRRCAGAPFSRFLFLSSFFLDLSPAWFNVSLFFFYTFFASERTGYSDLFFCHDSNMSCSSLHTRYRYYVFDLRYF